MHLTISRSQRLMAVIAISSAFFLAEISIGFYTHSLALVADAFHYLNDLVGFVVAFVADRSSKADSSPQELSFGWQRARILGAFFNGSLLFTLGISIFLQSIERFISLQRVENPKLMFIIGCIGLALNIISAAFLHEHDHHHHNHHHHNHEEAEIETPPTRSIRDDSDEHNDHRHLKCEAKSKNSRRDLGMMGVLLHVIGDAANNLGVMIAALIIWLTHYEGRYYADPGTSIGIAIMIVLSSIPLVKQSGFILLESAPVGVDHADVKHDLEKIPGVLAAHELHIWRLDQHKIMGTVHVVIEDKSVPYFSKLAKTIQECFHAYGIHSATVQAEVADPMDIVPTGNCGEELKELGLRGRYLEVCGVKCRTTCKELTCCG